MDGIIIGLGRGPFGHSLSQRAHDSRVFGRSADASVHLIAAFDTLYIIGLLFLGAILITAGMSFHIKRSSTWFMFIFSWFLTSLCNLLILGQQTGPSPAEGVCLAQAMFIYATPVLNSSTAVAFLLQVHITIRNAINGNSIAIPRKQMIMIHTFPWVLFCVVFIEILIMALLNPETIQRDTSGMYCHLSNKLPSEITAGITILAMLTFLTLGFLVFFRLRRKWQEVYTSTSAPNKTNFPPQIIISPDVAIRVLIFSFCPIIALTLSSVTYIDKPDEDQINLVLAVLPIIAGVIFGSQRDILRVWMNCVQRKKNNVPV